MLREKRTENNISFEINSQPRYFWVEATHTNLDEPERIDFRARIIRNDIHLDLATSPKMSKGFKFYLHSSLLDLEQRIDVFLNGQLVKTRRPGAGRLRNMDSKDPGFLFEDSIEIDL